MKWEEEKREETAAKMMEKFKGIMCKKEEACGKCHDIKEEKKEARFDIFVAATDKKINLKQHKIRSSMERRPNSKRGGLSSRPLRKKPRC